MNYGNGVPVRRTTVFVVPFLPFSLYDKQGRQQCGCDATTPYYRLETKEGGRHVHFRCGCCGSCPRQLCINRKSDSGNTHGYVPAVSLVRHCLWSNQSNSTSMSWPGAGHSSDFLAERTLWPLWTSDSENHPLDARCDLHKSILSSSFLYALPFI